MYYSGAGLFFFLNGREKKKEKEKNKADTNLNTSTITFLNLINFLHLRDTQLGFSTHKCSAASNALPLKSSIWDKLIHTLVATQKGRPITLQQQCEFTHHDPHCVHFIRGQMETVMTICHFTLSVIQINN